MAYHYLWDLVRVSVYQTRIPAISKKIGEVDRDFFGSDEVMFNDNGELILALGR
jgi:hypothetical protein